jgi:hypothetical protein
MPNSTVLATVGVIIASVAALASTTQAFISYSVRNQPIKAQIVSQIVQRCGENISLATLLSTHAATMLLAFAVDGTADHRQTKKVTEVANQLTDTVVFLRVLLDTLEPDASASLVNTERLMGPALIKTIDNKIDKATVEELARTTRQFEDELTRHCSAILRTAL